MKRNFVKLILMTASAMFMFPAMAQDSPELSMGTDIVIYMAWSEIRRCQFTANAWCFLQRSQSYGMGQCRVERTQRYERIRPYPCIHGGRL